MWLSQAQWELIDTTLAFMRQQMETMVADFSKFKEEQDRLIAKVDSLVGTVLQAVDKFDEAHDTIRGMAHEIEDMKADKLDQSTVDEAAKRLHALADDVGSSADMLHSKLVTDPGEHGDMQLPVNGGEFNPPMQEAPVDVAPVEAPAPAPMEEVNVEATPVEAPPEAQAEPLEAPADAPAAPVEMPAEAPVATEAVPAVEPAASEAPAVPAESVTDSQPVEAVAEPVSDGAGDSADAPVELPVEAPAEAMPEAPAEMPADSGNAMPVDGAQTEAAPETPAELKPE